MSGRFSFLEFFAGGGMARLGLAPDFECVFANDNDAKKCAVYRTNFGEEHLIEADVASLNAAELPTANLAWASFPCQDLSLAGGRGGMKAPRSGTFWAFWNLMLAMKDEGRAPKVIVIENVTGLLTSNRGKDFAALVAAFAEQNYEIGGIILDAADFVPQSRPRLFLVAWQSGLENFEGNPNRSDLLLRAVDCLPLELQNHWRWLGDAPRHCRGNDLRDIIDRNPPDSAWRTKAELQKLLSQMVPLHRGRVEAAVKARSFRVGAVYRRIRRGEQRAEVRYDGLAGCIRTLKGGSSRQLFLISQNGSLRLRPMLPREAARLMGLDDAYQLPKSATQAISLCGDGVCVPAVSWLNQNVLLPILRNSPEYLHLDATTSLSTHV